VHASFPPVRARVDLVGRYAIYEEIASGGMASVHFARLAGPSGSARTVAIKRAHPHLAREADFALMFLDEARLAARIQHPNVVSTIDVLSEPNQLLLVMEYVHGESLWKLARAAREKNERIPAPIAASILIDTLHGLQAAHEAKDESGEPLGIVHRDVSPQNILVGVDGISRLVDFGIAKAAGRLHSTHDSSVKGKYAYMAPEQIRGESVSRLTDTYAATIVFWELLTGERLFVGKTEAETIHKCLVGRVQAPSLFAPGLNRKLDEIVKMGLSRDPGGRYQTARDLALDIASCVPVAPASEVGAWVERIASDALADRGRVLAEIERSERRVSMRARGIAMGAVIVALAVGGTVLAAWSKGARLVPREATTASVVDAGAAMPAVAASNAIVVDAGATPPEVSARPSASTALPVAHPHAGAPSRTKHAKRAACTPPYSIDSDGKQIFKPECM